VYRQAKCSKDAVSLPSPYATVVYKTSN